MSSLFQARLGKTRRDEYKFYFITLTVFLITLQKILKDMLIITDVDFKAIITGTLEKNKKGK